MTTPTSNYQSPDNFYPILGLCDTYFTEGATISIGELYKSERSLRRYTMAIDSPNLGDPVGTNLIGGKYVRFRLSGDDIFPIRLSVGQKIGTTFTFPITLTKSATIQVNQSILLEVKALPASLSAGNIATNRYALADIFGITSMTLSESDGLVANTKLHDSFKQSGFTGSRRLSVNVSAIAKSNDPVSSYFILSHVRKLVYVSLKPAGSLSITHGLAYITNAKISSTVKDIVRYTFDITFADGFARNDLLTITNA